MKKTYTNSVTTPADAATVSATGSLTVSGTYDPATVDAVILSMGTLGPITATLRASTGTWTTTIPSADMASQTNGPKLLWVTFKKGDNTVASLYTQPVVTGGSAGHQVSGTVTLPAGIVVTAHTVLVVHVTASGPPVALVTKNLQTDIGYTGAAKDYAFSIPGVPDGAYSLGALVDLDGNFSTTGDQPYFYSGAASLKVAGADLTGQNFTLPGLADLPAAAQGTWLAGASPLLTLNGTQLTLGASTFTVRYDPSSGQVFAITAGGNSPLTGLVWNGSAFVMTTGGTSTTLIKKTEASVTLADLPAAAQGTWDDGLFTVLTVSGNLANLWFLGSSINLTVKYDTVTGQVYYLIAGGTSSPYPNFFWNGTAFLLDGSTMKKTRGELPSEAQGTWMDGATIFLTLAGTQLDEGSSKYTVRYEPSTGQVYTKDNQALTGHFWNGSAFVVNNVTLIKSTTLDLVDLPAAAIGVWIASADRNLNVSDSQYYWSASSSTSTQAAKYNRVNGQLYVCTGSTWIQDVNLSWSGSGFTYLGSPMANMANLIDLPLVAQGNWSDGAVTRFNLTGSKMDFGLSSYSVKFDPVTGMVCYNGGYINYYFSGYFWNGSTFFSKWGDPTPLTPGTATGSSLSALPVAANGTWSVPGSTTSAFYISNSQMTFSGTTTTYDAKYLPSNGQFYILSGGFGYPYPTLAWTGATFTLTLDGSTITLVKG